MPCGTRGRRGTTACTETDSAERRWRLEHDHDGHPVRQGAARCLPGGCRRMVAGPACACTKSVQRATCSPDFRVKTRSYISSQSPSHGGGHRFNPCRTHHPIYLSGHSRASCPRSAGAPVVSRANRLPLTRCGPEPSTQPTRQPAPPFRQAGSRPATSRIHAPSLVAASPASRAGQPTATACNPEPLFCLDRGGDADALYDRLRRNCLDRRCHDDHGWLMRTYPARQAAAGEAVTPAAPASAGSICTTSDTIAPLTCRTWLRPAKTRCRYRGPAFPVAPAIPVGLSQVGLVCSPPWPCDRMRPTGLQDFPPA